MPSHVQMLKLADSLFPALKLGKGNTIRTGHRSIVPGPLRFESVSGKLDPVTVEITSVRHTAVSELTIQELRQNGASDIDHFLAEMRRHYPDIGRGSDVTVASW